MAAAAAYVGAAMGMAPASDTSDPTGGTDAKLAQLRSGVVLHKVGQVFVKPRFVWVEAGELRWARASAAPGAPGGAKPAPKGSRPLSEITDVQPWPGKAHRTDTRLAARRTRTLALLGPRGHAARVYLEAASVGDRDAWVRAFRALLRREHGGAGGGGPLRESPFEGLSTDGGASSSMGSGASDAGSGAPPLGEADHGLPNDLFGALRALVRGLPVDKLSGARGGKVKRVVLWASLTLDQIYWASDPRAAGARADHCIVVRSVTALLNDDSSRVRDKAHGITGHRLVVESAGARLVLLASPALREWFLWALRGLHVVARDDTGVREAFLWDLACEEGPVARWPSLPLRPTHRAADAELTVPALHGDAAELLRAPAPAAATSSDEDSDHGAAAVRPATSTSEAGDGAADDGRGVVAA